MEKDNTKEKIKECLKEKKKCIVARYADLNSF